MIWDSSHEDLQLFWLSFKQWHKVCPYHDVILDVVIIMSIKVFFVVFPNKQFGKLWLTVCEIKCSLLDNKIFKVAGHDDHYWIYDEIRKNNMHYSEVIMDDIASQITSLTIVYSTVYSGADQRKHQSSASLVFVRGIHRWPVNSPHKGPVTRKIFPFDDVIMANGSHWPLGDFNKI